jgi:hypothetical protein
MVERQHYVPRGYLKGFTIEGTENDNLIWAYENFRIGAPQSLRKVRLLGVLLL